MLLERLISCDFGVFRGQRVFELAPRKKYGSARPVILFGGLNGAGKTTILTAVRTALYGRQSLGFGASQKVYEEFLGDLIHKNKNSLIPTNAASVTLEFTYSQLGRQSHYQVNRSWVKNGKRVDESLRIARDGTCLENLTQEQAQAFLNQLIPIGVSELFFFDGEKIARLASDSGEVALSASIRRLLGLDVLDKLKADLSIYSRQKRGKSLTDAEGLEVVSLQQQLDTLKQETDATLKLLREEVVPAIDLVLQELGHLEAQFKDSGGAWAVSREVMSARVNELILEKERISGEIRDTLGGPYPLSLSGELAKTLVQQVVKEQGLSRQEWLKEAISEVLDELRRELKKALPKVEFSKVETIISKETKRAQVQANKNQINVVHGLGDLDAARVMEILKYELPASVDQIGRLRESLEANEKELAQLGEHLAQAPAEGTLSDELDKIKVKSEELGQLRTKKQQLLEDVRSKLWAAIDINRKLRKLEEKAADAWQSSASLERAGSTISLLDDFSVILTKRKVEVLRRNFTEVFSRLARKEDLVVDALIDDTTFEVILVGKNGERIPKQSLSAGEKQVYAIAMLEALAKTSGRSLPIIIDTPLGRLDSQHRKKLVNHYFPRASHQVIILSTDTEVDQNFYRDLSPFMSHAFHLSFDENEGMTNVEEGYFWKYQERELRHAS